MLPGGVLEPRDVGALPAIDAVSASSCRAAPWPRPGVARSGPDSRCPRIGESLRSGARDARVGRFGAVSVFSMSRRSLAGGSDTAVPLISRARAEPLPRHAGRSADSELAIAKDELQARRLLDLLLPHSQKSSGEVVPMHRVARASGDVALPLVVPSRRLAVTLETAPFRATKSALISSGCGREGGRR